MYTYTYICIYICISIYVCVGRVRSFSVVSTFAGTENRRGNTAGGRKDSQVRGKGCGASEKRTGEERAWDGQTCGV